VTVPGPDGGTVSVGTSCGMCTQILDTETTDASADGPSDAGADAPVDAGTQG
jgi:hypothetical protein